MSLRFPIAAPSEDEIETGRKLFAGPVDFLKGVVAMSGLPPDDRERMVRRIADGLRAGGLLVLSEKVRHADPAIEATLNDLHLEFKRRHAYSELEIARKRAALESVLVPDTVGTHEERLRNAGFAHIGVWLRYFNFVSLLAVR